MKKREEKIYKKTIKESLDFMRGIRKTTKSKKYFYNDFVVSVKQIEGSYFLTYLNPVNFQVTKFKPFTVKLGIINFLRYRKDKKMCTLSEMKRKHLEYYRAYKNKYNEV